MQPGIDQIYTWLDGVPDPEIPVISLMDLGIIRDVAWAGDTLNVTVTPTYSGCPATSIINLDIVTALNGHGIEKVEIKRQLSPVWTTAWISKSGRDKLKAYGIAPPDDTATCAGMLPEMVVCPRCGNEDTEMISGFGSTPCKAQYRCKNCLEPFDYFKAI